MNDIQIERSGANKMKVDFLGGEAICLSSAKQTFIEALRKIGTTHLNEINIEINHLPLFFKNNISQV